MKTFLISLVTTVDGLVVISKEERADTTTEAMNTAKKLAGRGSKYWRKVISHGYVGLNGTSYIT